MKHLHGSALQRPKPKNFYEVGEVQVRVFEHHVALWMKMGGAWVKRMVQMRKLTSNDNGKPMMDSYELVNAQGVHLPIDIETQHIPENIRNTMDATIKKAHVLWLLHNK